MTDPNTAIRNILVCANQWSKARQKLRELTARAKDLHDRKSSTKEDFVKAKKALDAAQAELIQLAEKLEKASNAFAQMPAPSKRRKRPVDLRKLAQGVGVLAGAFEQALTPQPPQVGALGNVWKPPGEVIEVQVIDATPKKTP